MHTFKLWKKKKHISKRHTATISLNDNDPAGGRSTLHCCARSRPPERAQVLPSPQLQIHRPSLILPFFPFPSHPPSLNQASLCFQIGLSFSLGARSLAVGSCGRSSDGLALISRIVLSLDPLCAFSSYSRKKHWSGYNIGLWFPVSTIDPLGLGDEGYSIYWSSPRVFGRLQAS